jgi:hypothetical protein
MIPEIIHQLWVAPLNEYGQREIELAEGWKAHNPDWEYKLWTPTSLFPLHNRTVYNSTIHCTEEFRLNHKYNIAKYEILHRYGGLWVDPGFESLKPIDFDLGAAGYLAENRTEVVLLEANSTFAWDMVMKINGEAPNVHRTNPFPFYLGEIIPQHQELTTLPTCMFYPYDNIHMLRCDLGSSYCANP